MNKQELKLFALTLAALGTVGNDTTNKNSNEKYDFLDQSEKQKSKPKIYVKTRYSR